MQGSIHTFDTATAGGSLLLDDGRLAGFDAAALDGSGLRSLRLGQRVSLTLAEATEGEASELRADRIWVVGIGDGARIR